MVNVRFWFQVAPGVVSQVTSPPVWQAQIDITTVTGSLALDRSVPPSWIKSPNSLMLRAWKAMLPMLPAIVDGMLRYAVGPAAIAGAATRARVAATTAAPTAVLRPTAPARANRLRGALVTCEISRYPRLLRPLTQGGPQLSFGHSGRKAGACGQPSTNGPRSTLSHKRRHRPATRL